MKYFRLVLPYARPYWRLLVASLILTVAAALAGLLTPWPLKILIDSVLGDQPLHPVLARPLGPLLDERYGLLVFVVFAGLGLTLFEHVIGLFTEYVHTKLQQHMVLDFRGDLFQHAQRLSLAFHDQARSGQLIYAINFQADEAAGLVMAIQPLIQSLLMLVGMFWVTFKINPQLALISLVVVPFLYYAVGYYTRNIQERIRQVKGMEGETLSIIHEAMSMLRVIVAFGREGHEYRRFREQGERAVDARVKLTVRETLFSMAVNMTTAAGTALVLGFGAYQVLQGHLTAGELLVVMAYVASVYGPLEAISSTVGSFQDKFVSLQIASNLFETEPEIKDKPEAIQIERARGEMSFESVSFSYTRDGRTLRDISFEAPAGKVIAIVGPTGAGKSTLVSLVPRFYDPTGGRIVLDGHDIRDLAVQSLREQISIVLQEPLLFSGTIADNIRYSRLEASTDEITQAAKDANAHDFIMRLPKGYETEIGERGARLSGGERQRISVARAFLKDAPILILDEPTSSIDSKTEAVILDALERLMAGRTTFMIAHRLSTIRHADIILVMNHGELVEQGTHDELLQAGGLYKELHDVQAGQARARVQASPELVTAGGIQEEL